MRRTDVGLAYLFWLPSLTGIAGLHRFYLGKPISGFLYLITFGLFGLGTFYDAVTMPQLVRRVRTQERLDRILDGELPTDWDAPGPTIAFPRRRGAAARGADTRGAAADAGSNGIARGGPFRTKNIDQTILSLAEERHGLVTPSRVALRAGVSPDKARDKLDRLVRQGFADVRVSRDGVMLYVFPEFFDESGRDELDSLT